MNAAAKRGKPKGLRPNPCRPTEMYWWNLNGAAMWRKWAMKHPYASFDSNPTECLRRAHIDLKQARARRLKNLEK